MYGHACICICIHLHIHTFGCIYTFIMHLPSLSVCLSLSLTSFWIFSTCSLTSFSLKIVLIISRELLDAWDTAASYQVKKKYSMLYIHLQMRWWNYNDIFTFCLSPSLLLSRDRVENVSIWGETFSLPFFLCCWPFLFGYLTEQFMVYFCTTHHRTHPHVCMCVYICTWIYTYAHTHTCIYICMCVHTHIYVYKT